jgi:beta-lactamase superfamily II metal-dependent hydrolase
MTSGPSLRARRYSPAILSNLWLRRGLGLPTDRNNSGYVMRLDQHDEAVLLTGDVAYEHIHAKLRKGLMAL